MDAENWPPKFLEKIALGPTGCWLWLGTINREGYGLVWTDENPQCFAHRHAWSLSGRSLPEGMHVHHRCRVRRCVNPDHLDLLTHAEHMGAHKEFTTHCANGHAFTVETTYVYPNGTRDCRICRTRRRAEYRQKQKTARVV